MLTLDAFAGLPDVPRPTRRRRLRHDWVRGDVRCLMCGRLLGRLLGTTRSSDNGNRPTGHPVAFLAYRPLDPVGRIVAFRPGLRFRCRLCGGVGALDEIDVFSTYEQISAQEAEDDPLPRPRGRPPRPFPTEQSDDFQTVLDGL
jgi:hypothetical protein